MTFSTVSDGLTEHNEILPDTIGKPKEIIKSEPIVKLKKKNDSFARARLSRIKRYKFKGLYFGGVDLKSNMCIKIPSQKEIRTRRRTYSAADGDHTPETPLTPIPKGCITGFRKGRAKSQHNGSPRYNINGNVLHKRKSHKRTVKQRKGSRGVVLQKSLSTRIITDNSESVLATISSEESMTPKRRKPKKTPPMPQQIKTRSLTMHKYHITPKHKVKNRKNAK